MVRRPYVPTFMAIVAFLLASAGNSAAQSDWKAEWERTLALARKEGKVVVAASPSAELRQALEAAFGNRFPGIQLELLTGVSSNIARRITDEYKAGIKNVDVLLSGTTTPLGLAAIGGLLPVEANFILPEVRDPKQWWGGHIWVDNIATNRFIYSFQAHLPFLIWYNTAAMKAEEVRSYDDLLNPKWKGKMGFRDPRLQGGGQSLWVYMGMVKGEGFLRKLAQQEILLSDNPRLLPENLAKGSLSLVLGLSYYQYLPFIKSGIPLKALPIPREGINATSSSGALTMIKNSPHPNGSRVFVNWLLSKEGQEIYGKAHGQATRRLDVDTKWMEEVGARAAKDFLTVEEYYKRQIDLEDKSTTIWPPAVELANKVFK